MKNLTKFQQRLITDLTNQFLSLNPTSSGGSSVANKRFSIATIDDCINEESRLRKSMAKHNDLMAKTFIGQFDSDIKEFEEEFGGVLTTQVGYHGRSQNGPTMYSTKETFIAERRGMNVYLVSKVKEHSGSDAYARKCNGKQYLEIAVTFKTERIKTTLDSGKEVNLNRIIGLAYMKPSTTSFNKDMSHGSLDDYIQRNPTVQQNIVQLSTKK